MTEKEKMISESLYDPNDSELSLARQQAQSLCQRYNATLNVEKELRWELLRQLLGHCDDSCMIQPPFYCDYGQHIHLGSKVYMNVNCVILDVCQVTIGEHTLLGPSVHIYTATHPLDYKVRRRVESGRAVSIGSDVWLGGGVIVCPGVTIGARTVIGAGSIVTRDIPDGVLAFGNPCRVMRQLD